MTRTALKRLYLNKDRAVISGVCAGLADYLDVDIKLVRVIFGLGLFFWMPVAVVAYFALAWFVDAKPDEEGETTTRSEADNRAMPHRRRFAKMHTRYQKLEERLRALESVVTSRAFQVDRELGRR